MSHLTGVISSVIQELDTVGERINSAISEASSDAEIQLLEDALISLSETRTLLQGKTPVSQVNASVTRIRPLP
ncbi:hypothetical protein AB7W88_19935 [Providencia vermicola]|jgi:cell division ATPase FtsA|uniref:Uncharacterized protein n=5 Tax=Morganellaceae TaxID=1903414 RepID=A0A899NFY4_PROST|nr:MULTISPECIES: hypothetical protein [Enterobacterales]ELB1111600.1 hypothetical protein [Morganella morganii]ELL8908949.1 hypothetical protein [Proteus mirabilis]ELQ1458652.1 hypothetical protein [Providencia rettgeri]ELR5098736.1 hypothetical protein [Providencia rettgeri]ELR5179501.1 hypothetical protein [Providencia rettgeri]